MQARISDRVIAITMIADLRMLHVDNASDLSYNDLVPRCWWSMRHTTTLPPLKERKNMFTNTRKVRVTAQQVAFLMLTEGTSGILALHNRPGCEIARATFDSAVDLLAAQPETQSALVGLQADLYGDITPGERGRPAAKVGDSRSYKVQQVGEQDPFIRLPVSLLGSAKGNTVTVVFGNGQITVKV